MNKKQLLLIPLLTLLLSFSFTLAQVGEQSAAEKSPLLTQTGSDNPTEAIWDVKFDWNLETITGALGNAGVVYLPNVEQFWVSRWASGVITVISKTGTFVEQFTLPVTGTRGMAFDGQHVYHAVNTGTLQKVDPATKQIVGTVTLPTGVTARFITYDPTADNGQGGFWVGNWNAGALNYFRVSKTGAQIGVIQNTAITGTYGIAFDYWSVGGPFLWVWSQGQGQGFPQNIIQLSVATGLPTGVQHDVITDVGIGNASAIAGGMFISDQFMPGYVIMGGVLQGTPDKLFGYELAVLDAGPLMPFNLTAPAAGAVVESFPNSSTPVTITWDTSRAAATYKWIFGAPTVPPRTLSVATGTNQLTFTLGELDNILAGLGLQPGQQVVGQWDVWAFRNNMPANDSLKATNGPRAITLKRGVPQLTAFNLQNPPNNTTITTSVFNNNPINITWTASGEGVKYKWKFGTNLLKVSSAVLVLPSNNNGYATTLTVINSALDGILAGLGIPPGGSTSGQWTVYAYSGTDSLKAVESFNITFTRQAKGDVLVAYDSTATQGRVSRDSVMAYLNMRGITFDLFNRGSNTSTNVMTFRGYKKIIWLGEGTSILANPQKDSLKAYLNNPGVGKSKLIIAGEDVGYMLGRSASTYYDLDFVNNYLGFNFVADRPPSGAAQQLKWVYYVPEFIDSTIGTWPDVISVFNPLNGHHLLQFSDLTYNATGKVGTTNNVVVFGHDIESLRRSYFSPPGSPHVRFLDYAMLYVDNDGIIPVELKSFNAAITGNLVSLNWVTATEMNNRGFEVQRKIDEGSFETIAFIEGKGTTMEQQSYTFTDKVSIAGKYSYRLKQVDFDGSSSLTDAVEVDVLAPAEFSLSQNYPNPFNPTTTINFGLAADANVTLKVYNALGQEVATLISNEMKAGTHQVELNASALSSGVYFYRIEAQGLNGNNFTSVKKMMLMK